MVERGEIALPSELARADGFFFWSEAAKEALGEVADLLEEGVSPICLTGPRGAGKASLLRHLASAWPGSARVMSAAVIDPSDPALSILAAFGHRPLPGTPARLALIDFIEDESEAGRPPLLVVPRSKGLDEDRRQGLTLLARAALEGGAGLLVAMAGSSGEGSAEVRLRGLTPEETGEVVGLLWSFIEDAPAVNEAVLEKAYAQSGGLIGHVCRWADANLARPPAAQGRAYEPIAPPSSERPSPEEIEQALLAIGGAEEGPEPQPAPPKVYPRLGTGEPVLPASGPANDRGRPLSPAVADGLEEVARTIAELQGRVEVLRDWAGGLRRASSERRHVLVQNTQGVQAALDALSAPLADSEEE
ncbi:hypothetical protein [Parvularcula maris]|uniref:Uncharacterized protein n=1 Tax=Parvularcula maris TaxID=2965077 RepID=A0A9X2L8G4_9PROT|nr:hypothetical protein [Parvularcula maris]MCQ8185016.1 hypothetical protein [Parvularcula maris]